MNQVAKLAAGAIRKIGLREPILHLTSSQYRRQRAITQDLIRCLDAKGFERIRREHSSPNDPVHKYLKLQTHVADMVRFADRLGLLDAPPKRVCDLGSGTGMFLYVLRNAGHDVRGLDLDETTLYNSMIEFLEIPRVTHRIERYKPLPDIGERLDLITAFSIMFDCHGEEVDEPVWMSPEWKFFIDDCLTRLIPGGRLFVNFNPATKCEFDFMPDEVADWLRTLPGATLSSNKELLSVNRPGQ